VAELKINAESYLVPEENPKPRRIMVTRFPTYLRNALDTLRHSCAATRSPSLNTALNCCLSHSIGYFYSRETKALLKAKKDLSLKSATAKDVQAVDLVIDFLEHFPLDVSGGNGSKPVSVNVAMPPALFKQIERASKDLGISKYTIVILCALLVVSKQTACNPQHREQAEQAFNMFRERLSLVTEVADLVIRKVAKC
jgi:hypothetical protein